MPVLPRPGLCSARAVCASTSPRMYDSVKRFEPTFRLSALTCAHAAASATAVMSVRKLGDALDPARRRIAEELQRRESCVQPALAQKVGMRALRYRHAVLHDDDAVGVLHRRQAVRDDK